MINFKSLAIWISDGNSHITKTRITLEGTASDQQWVTEKVWLYCLIDTLINYAQTTKNNRIRLFLYMIRELTKKVRFMFLIYS